MLAPVPAPSRRMPAEPPVLARLGTMRARLAATRAEVEAAQRLRHRVFRGREGCDSDAFDALCDHLIVEADGQEPGGEVIATYRLLPEGAGRSYVATEFATDALRERHPGLRFLELGRSCVAPEHRTRRVMELLWAATWGYVVENGYDVMLGCASLPGTDPDRSLLAFLHARARAPEAWRVGAQGHRGVAMLGEPTPPRDAMRRLPPLVKGYLRLGAWVGEDAVVDHDWGTTDVLVLLHRGRIARRYLDHFGERATLHRS